MNDLMFSTYQLNNHLTLKNRIVMAPMTRCMAGEGLVPTQQMADYYKRRADAGLIISEGILIRRDALGYPNVPGIYTEAQVQGWKNVVDSVHANGGLIFAQLWHVGRVSHPEFLNGELPISASETQMEGEVKRKQGLRYGKSREATLSEIHELIESYANAARNAMKAGFDGIELHGANGYLIDQFLHHHTNLRQDGYGGTIENRARFALEVVKACGEAIGYEKVGIRLSPGAYVNEIIGDLRDGAVFQYLLEQLNYLNMAYVHTGSFDDAKTYPELGNKTMTAFIRSYFHGTVIACGNYTFEHAKAGISQKQFDLVAIGKPFLANPNYMALIKQNMPIRNYEPAMLNTLY